MNETKEINKKNNTIGIIIIILLVILIGLVSLLLLKNNDSKEDQNTNSNNPQPTNSTIQDDSQEDQNPVQIPDTEKEEVFDISKFDETKGAINSANDITYKLVNNDASDMGLSATLNPDKRSVTVIVDWSKYSSSMNKGGYIDEIAVTETKNYTINNFNQNVQKVYILGFGQWVGSETIFYIMEDGTVEYTPLRYSFNINKDSNINSNAVLKSYGTIQGVSEVVEIASGDQYAPSLAGGGISILGVKNDYSFYDLSDILIKTNYYSFN